MLSNNELRCSTVQPSSIPTATWVVTAEAYIRMATWDIIINIYIYFFFLLYQDVLRLSTYGLDFTAGARRQNEVWVFVFGAEKK